MGIVIRQSFWNSIFIYAGFLLGAINILILFRPIIGDENFGLTRIILSVAYISSEVALLGSPTMFIKYFPFFKDEKKKGIILFSLLIATLGIVVTGILLIIFQEPIIELKRGDSDLFANYFLLTIPVLLGVGLFKFFQAFLKSLLKSTIPVFLNDVLQRVYITIWLLAYYFFEIPISTWLTAFCFIYMINPLVMILYLWRQGNLDLSWSPRVNIRFMKESMTFGLWNLLAGASMSLVNNIDIFMVGVLLTNGEVKAGFYTIALYMVSLVVIPTRAISSIVQPLIAQMFKNNDFPGLKLIYSQTSINQLILCGAIFIVIWVNIDLLFQLLGDDPNEGKWIVLFVGFARLFSVATGVNGLLINHSKFFRSTTYFTLVLAVLTVFANIIFIPRLGLNGAAIATAFSLFTFNFLKWAYVWMKLKMQPFSVKSLIAVIFGCFSIGISYLLPDLLNAQNGMVNMIFEIIVRTLICGGVFLALVYGFNLSTELNRIVQNTLKIIKR